MNDPLDEFELTRQIAENQRRILASTRQGPDIVAAVAAAVSGDIGDRVGLGRSYAPKASTGLRQPSPAPLSPWRRTLRRCRQLMRRSRG